MEKMYDDIAAKAALSTHCRREHDEAGNEQLSHFKSEGYQMYKDDHPNIFKLIKETDDLSQLEEASFTAYGIILEKELPPIQLESRFLRDERSKNRYAGYIRQYVAISGLNISEFNETLQGLERVHRFFNDSLPKNNLEPMEPLLIDGNFAMACHTRYFLRNRFCKSKTPHPFGPGVDPSGDLGRLAGNSYIHTDENAVQYLGKKGESEKYVNINPVRFQSGDIVEVTVSFFCIQTHSNTLKMMTSLKSLTLLDDTFREKARDDQAKSLLSQNVKATKSQVKRRFVNVEGDDSLVTKCARMDI